MVSGIYEIKNKLNNLRYIGSSINIDKRFGEHFRLLCKNSHHSRYLQNAWNKYGEKNFEFNVLEECEPIKDTLLFIEQKYLDLKPEYNICKVAGNTIGVVFSEERINKIRIANSNRIIKDSTRLKHRNNSKNSKWVKNLRVPIIMLDKNNKEIRRFDSISEAAHYTGHINHRVDIKRCLLGIYKYAYGYKWIKQ